MTLEQLTDDQLFERLIKEAREMEYTSEGSEVYVSIEAELEEIKREILCERRARWRCSGKNMP